MINRIFELMAEKSLKSKDLAEGIGISTGNISDWKVGRAKPSIEALSKIADFLDVSVDYLIGRTDYRYTPELFDINRSGVLRWMEDRAFKPEERAELRANFQELLFRYKCVLNELANSMYSRDRRKLIEEGGSVTDISMMTSNAIHDQLFELIRWVAIMPFDFNKRFRAEDEITDKLCDDLCMNVNVIPPNRMDEYPKLSEDESDLLEIWRNLDKDGRRLLLGLATEQKQRIMTQKSEERA